MTLVTDAGLAQLADLARLQGLHLYATPITGPGLLHLVGRCPAVATSTSAATRLDDAGLEASAGSRSLRVLSLVGTGVTGCRPRPPERPDGLAVLNLQDTPVTDADLEGLTGLTGLTRLGVSPPGVTAGRPGAAPWPPRGSASSWSTASRSTPRRS